jgi:CRP-like cAMP-binding protein
VLEKEHDTRTDQECKDLLPLVFDLPFMKEHIKNFNEAECRQVANKLRIRKFVKDKRIFCAGDKADDFFVIVRG